MQIQTQTFKTIGETLCSVVLDNGLRVFVIPKKGFSSYCAVFGTDYGSTARRFALDGKTFDTPAGVAHYLEHKMFDMPNGDNALQKMSAMGADPNAFTSFDETVYYFHCTDNFYDNLRELLHYVSTPYFTEETVEKEQGIIAQEIRMGDDDPDSVIYFNLMKLLYRHHAVRDDIAGTVESIRGITADMLYACHRAFYAPSNMVLCVEGDVDPEHVAALAEEVLGSEKRPVPQPDFGEEEICLPVQKRVEQAMSVSQNQFLIGAAFKPGKDGPLRERIVASLALRMLCGSSSPFYMRLYREGLLSRNFGYAAEFPANLALVNIGGESREPDRVLAEILQEVQRIGREGFDPALFERAKRASFGARLRGFEDFDSVCFSTLDAAFDGCCAFDSLEILASVTAEECRDFLCRTLTEERCALSIITPKKD